MFFLTFSSPGLEIRRDDVPWAKEIHIKFATCFPNHKCRNIKITAMLLALMVIRGRVFVVLKCVSRRDANGGLEI